MDTSAVPAILGGPAVRPGGLPCWPPDDPVVSAVLQRLATSGEWGRYHGPHTEALVERIAAETEREHVVLCSSGTAGVEFALRGVGVTSGDEVILAAYDFQANFRNVIALDAVPVLVDVRPDDVRIDVAELDEAVSERTRAVLVSHLHGGLVEMEAVGAWSREHGVAVVEDGCQASGAVVEGRPVGGSGDVGVLSFGGSKLLTAGRGGAVVTHRADVAQRIRLWKERGNDVSPLSQMQAAVLLPQWDALAERHARRAERVATLRARLSDGSGLRPFTDRTSQGDSPAFYKLGFWYDAEAFGGLARVSFCEAMRAEGIPLDPGFRGLHRIHGRRRFRGVGRLDVATTADETVVVLHHPYLLEPEASVDDFVRALDKIRDAATMIRDDSQRRG